MEFNYDLQANLHHLIYSFAPENADAEDQFNEDCLGVGAMMPQELPESMFLAEPDSYGI
jgi:hypothetical protein